MATRQDIEAKLAAIDQKKADALKALQAKRVKLKAKLAQLNRPTKSARRLDARRKILLGAFVLEQLERTGSSPQALTFEGKCFFDWLVRPNDRTVFETTANASSTSSSPSPQIPSSAPRIASIETPLNVPFADKDRAKALGAQWHADQKLWVVPAGRDLTPFASWLQLRRARHRAIRGSKSGLQGAADGQQLRYKNRRLTRHATAGGTEWGDARRGSRAMRTPGGSTAERGASTEPTPVSTGRPGSRTRGFLGSA